jgi:hypothetical protein
VHRPRRGKATQSPIESVLAGRSRAACASHGRRASCSHEECASALCGSELQPRPGVRRASGWSRRPCLAGARGQSVRLRLDSIVAAEACSHRERASALCGSGLQPRPGVPKASGWPCRPCPVGAHAHSVRFHSDAIVVAEACFHEERASALCESELQPRTGVPEASRWSRRPCRAGAHRRSIRLRLDSIVAAEACSHETCRSAPCGGQLQTLLRTARRKNRGLCEIVRYVDLAAADSRRATS